MSAHSRGSISGLFVCVLMSLMALVGLTVEGGRVVHAYGELASLAETASRMGGQEVFGIQDGEIQIDVSRAMSRMSKFLAAHQETGEFSVDGLVVSVTVKRVVRTPFLQLLGVESRTVTVTRSAAVVKG